MRLINSTTRKIHQFPGDSTEDYAILSHTWAEEECTLEDMATDGVKKLKGYEKIAFCCDQALVDGLSWVWVDTCCIDKTSTVELSEAINSMFRWYSNAKLCYAWLADVTNQAEIASSRWFSRGWTLQELIAPTTVRFYSTNWTCLGLKSELCDVLHKITGIDASVLSTGDFSRICIAKRMSWAAKRTTTRIEDEAYSLMGILGVNMPLIYGEGKMAFMRLQQEILRVSDDQSLFAWGAPKVFPDIHNFLTSWRSDTYGLFADSPADFLTGHEILQARSQKDSSPPAIHGNGVRLEYPICSKGVHQFIVLACTTRKTPRAYIGIPVKNWDGSFYARCGPLVLIFPEDWMKARSKVLVVKEPPVGFVSPLPATFQVVRVPNGTRKRRQDPFLLDEVFCLPHANYHPAEHSITISSDHRGPHAALFFASSTTLERLRRSVPGVFPILSFAIILGSSKYPWAIFVPILRDAHADADFHEILRETTEMAKHCMTKYQLKEKLFRDDMTALLPRTRSFDGLLSAWHISPSVYRNLEIAVDLEINQINLVDEAVFVSIDIYEINVEHEESIPAFVHSQYAVSRKKPVEKRAKYHPNWLTMDELEWFIDRIPWDHPNWTKT
ncbi:heterokaryon incompatibility protein-domain-containing protein [Xylaria sp. FL0043]|nr:heterokaryon incompatibility protein-domain-containing protein [Xylaria sp. FL0043]